MLERNASRASVSRRKARLFWIVKDSGWERLMHSVEYAQAKIVKGFACAAVGAVDGQLWSLPQERCASFGRAQSGL